MQNTNLDKPRHFLTLILILGLGLLGLAGCEGYGCGEGIVYDAKTKKPLDSVFCVSNSQEKIYTDSSGKYNLCGPFGGCMPHCPDVVIEFSKTGYKSQKVTNPNKVNIYLEKE
jgi:hypothetical protein